MPINWIAVGCAALIPLAVGSVWYNVFGQAWMKASGVTEEQVKSANMPLIIGLSLLFSLMLATITAMLTIHQVHFYSILVDEPGMGKQGSELMAYIGGFMKKYGSNFRTFKHGAFHGFFSSIMFALPLIGTHALYERRGAKYVGIHWGYWAVSLSLMGGLICGWTP